LATVRAKKKSIRKEWEKKAKTRRGDWRWGKVLEQERKFTSWQTGEIKGVPERKKKSSSTQHRPEGLLILREGLKERDFI